MCAGAFAMAAGEYVSVRSQRELFEYQIGLERDELAPVSGGRGAGTGADLRGQGPAARRRRCGSRRSIIADPEHALDTLAREELGLNPDELGLALGRGDLVVPRRSRAGALLPLAPFVLAPGPRALPIGDRRHRARAVRRRRDAVAVHRPQRDRLGRCGCWRWARSPAPSPTRSAGSPVSRSADPAADAELRVLKPGRDKSLLQRHPWIFSGAIADVDGTPAAGDTVAVRSADGALARPRRVSRRTRRSARASGRFDAARGRSMRRSSRAASRARSRARAGCSMPRHTGCRLVHGESDGLPGVIADRYGDVVVLQLVIAGAERWRDAHRRRAGAAHRRDLRLRALGRRRARARGPAAAQRASLRGSAAGRRSPSSRTASPTASTSPAARRPASTSTSATTAPRVRALARGPASRSTCSATPAASRWRRSPAAPRASLSIDSSADALALARANLARNPSLAQDAAEWREADAFAELRRLRDAARELRPRSCSTRPSSRRRPRTPRRAARAYKDINLLALKLLRPGGLLATFSCSGGIDAELFRKIVAGAALDAARRRGGHRPLRRERRPPGRARVSRRRLPEGAAAAQGRR